MAPANPWPGNLPGVSYFGHRNLPRPALLALALKSLTELSTSPVAHYCATASVIRHQQTVLLATVIAEVAGENKQRHEGMSEYIIITALIAVADSGLFAALKIF